MKCFDLHEAFRSHFKAAFSEWKFNKGKLILNSVASTPWLFSDTGDHKSVCQNSPNKQPFMHS